MPRLFPWLLCGTSGWGNGQNSPGAILMRLQTYVTLEYLVEMQYIYIYYTHINTCRYLWENGDLWNFWCLFCSRKISHQNHGGLAGRGQMHRLTGDVNVVRAVFNLRSTCGRPSNASLEKKGLICWLWDLMSEILGKCSDLWHDARCLAGNSLTLADVFSHW